MKMFVKRAPMSLVLWATLVLLCCFSQGGIVASHVGLQQRSPKRQVPERAIVFGHSVQGRPLRAFVLGGGTNVTMIFADFHGNERSGPDIVERLHAYLQQQSDQWPNCTAILVPFANPDGWKAGTRVNAHHVDINRNFPGSWMPVAHKARHNPGPSAASEPETRAIMALVDHYSPTKILSIHQPLHLLNWTGSRGRRLAAIMGRDNHYPLSSSVGYATPGSFGDYCGKRGVAIVTLEMPRVSAAKGWQQNRGALMAAITLKE